MDALNWLKLQMEWGADEALDEAPVDRRARADAAVPPTQAPRPAPAASPATGPAARAEALAAAADTPEALRAALEAFDGCSLSITATNLVFRDGDPASRIVLVADVPGAEEDRAGLPFAGANAALLERMLSSIGVARQRFLAISVLPWRPPGGRRPEEAELRCCVPFFYRHLELIQPTHLLLFGALSVQTLFPGPARRRKPGWQTVEREGLPASMRALSFATLSNIAVIPAAKRDAWSSLLLLKAALG